MLAGVAFHKLVLPAIEHILPLLGSADAEVPRDSDSGLALSREILHLDLRDRSRFRLEAGWLGAGFIALRNFGEKDRVAARAFGARGTRPHTFDQILGANIERSLREIEQAIPCDPAAQIGQA